MAASEVNVHNRYRLAYGGSRALIDSLLYTDIVIELEACRPSHRLLSDEHLMFAGCCEYRPT